MTCQAIKELVSSKVAEEKVDFKIDAANCLDEFAHLGLAIADYRTSILNRKNACYFLIQKEYAQS